MQAVCDFRVVDEREEWIVVEKPAPLAVHPANGRWEEPTLLSGLRTLMGYEVANGATLSILTRLDRETSGLVLVAKEKEAAKALSRQFEQRAVAKEYQAIVHGWPEWHRRRVEEPILRAGTVQPSEIWLRRCVHPEGKPSTTRMEVGCRFRRGGRDFAVIRCRPETGRTHQIRVHLEHLGHPLVGDKIYGSDGRAYLEQLKGPLSTSSIADLILPRQALHATRLSVNWGGEEVEWCSELPQDLARFVPPRSLEQGHGDSRRDQGLFGR